MARSTKTPKAKKSSSESKPKSSSSGLQKKADSFAPESHPFIKKLAANGK